MDYKFDTSKLTECTGTQEKHTDYWLIAMVTDGEWIHYIEVSPDADMKDILVNGNWEDDNLMLPDTMPEYLQGVYKFRLHPCGSGDGGMSGDDYWYECEMELIETIWEPNMTFWNKLKRLFK